MAAFAWRPFFLGFYSDDYVGILLRQAQGQSAQQLFDYYSSNFATRPITGLFAYGLTRVCGDDPFLWHSIAAVVSLAFGCLIWLVLAELNRIEDPLEERHITWISCLWLVLPTSFGFLSWPMYFTHFPALFFFLCSFYLLIRTTDFPASRALFAFITYCLCLLTYEGFYFLYFVPFGIVVLKLEADSIRDRFKWKIVGWFSLFTIAQAGAIVLQSSRRPLNPNFVLTRITSVLENPGFIVQALIPLLIVITAIIIGVAMVVRIRRHSFELTTHHWLLLILLGGLLSNVMLFLAAGYSIRPFGTGSRTTMCVSFLSAFALLPALKLNSKRLRAIYSTRWWLLLVLLLSTGLQGYYWHTSWVLQKEVLSKLPAAEFETLDSPGVVVCVVPNFVSDVMVFEETWTLQAAVEIHYPELKEFRFLPHKNTGFRAASLHFFERRVNYHFEISAHHAPSYRAKHLYVWNYYTGEILVAKGNVIIPHHGLDPENFSLNGLSPI